MIRHGSLATLPSSMLNFISRRDHRLMRRVHRWHAPRWVRLWMILATRGGDGWLWYTLGIVILICGGPSRLAVVFAAATASCLGIGIYSTLKKLTDRKRPCALDPHCWANVPPPDQYSFPSGHTINAFAIAMAFGLFYPHLMAALLFCAFSVGISRIVLGLHFLSDVVAGAVIGVALGYTAFWLFT
jgi:undecaprenyl-diphosphatase